MVVLSEQRIDDLFASMAGKRIAVIGDLMLDRYIWGSVSRISPEAPVPVIDMETEQARLGGAANVARNIKSLGGEPLLVGVIGADTSGKQLYDIIRETGFSPEGVIVDPSRPTTVKTRVIAHSQHVVRLDREQRTEVSAAIQRKIIDVLRMQLSHLSGIIIEDYNKGVVVKNLIHDIIGLANEGGKPVTVDPKFNNFFEYKNITVFKPNRKEAEEALGVRLHTEDDIQRAGNLLLERLQAKNVLLTLGERGMSLFESDGTSSHVPTKARNVADVSGAGDTVIASLTMSLVAGATVREAAALANHAGGVVCGYVGIVPIDKNELRQSMLADAEPVPKA
ncbi:MAG TPA: D-glycero-beta-D-manno-heptose-7-phosphate kinase [Bacteroidota bacterium]|nr:D-glycero-beta-D-manno-heptose-7-phosphate kinase [Bacteroidota bacterium]